MRAGREFKACCPFHHEKTPSFTINDDKQFYHCFGCGAHGDVINFVMKHDNLDFMSAVEALSADAGLQVPKLDPIQAQKAQRVKDLYDLMDEAANWFTAQLYARNNKDVLSYLEGRSMSRESLASFRVGYAPADRQALRTHLKAQGYNDSDMSEAGLLRKNDKSPEPYIFFRDRVMFPVSDRRGRVVAFGGRILPEHIRPSSNDGFTPPKYINSSDTPLFDKGRMIYNEQLARQAVRDNLPVIVTEGYMDVIACAQGGFKGAVAPMGTALTEDQITLLWAMIPGDEKVPILCFDGDNAGRKAAVRACERALPLLKPGCSLSFAFMPDGEDPDSLIKSGGNKAFQKILSNASSLLEFLWASHMGGRNFETPEARAGVVKALENQIKSITDRDVQYHYQALIRAKVSETFFRRGGQNKGYKTGGFRKAIATIKPRSPVFRDIYARALMAAIINHPFIYEDVEEPFGQLALVGERLNSLRQNVISILTHEPDLNRDSLCNHLISQGFEKEISDILNESVYVHARFASPGVEAESVTGKWMELWDAVQERGARHEIKQGWKQAFEESSEETEDKMRYIIGKKRNK